MVGPEGLVSYCWGLPNLTTLSTEGGQLQTGLTADLGLATHKYYFIPKTPWSPIRYGLECVDVCRHVRISGQNFLLKAIRPFALCPTGGHLLPSQLIA
jgi:hypothetical protein